MFETGLDSPHSEPHRRARRRRGILPDDERLFDLLVEAETGNGLRPLAVRLGVGIKKLADAAKRLGVSGRRQVRYGLPDDETLARDIRECSSMRALSVRYGVRDYHVRNQAKRLGVRPGDPEGPLRTLTSQSDSLASLRRRASEAEALVEIALADIAVIERQRDKIARREDFLQRKANALCAELDRLRLAVNSPTEAPTDLDGILAEAQATGFIVM